jgi:hypothetical protein
MCVRIVAAVITVAVGTVPVIVRLLDHVGRSHDGGGGLRIEPLAEQQHRQRAE